MPPFPSHPYADLFPVMDDEDIAALAEDMVGFGIDRGVFVEVFGQLGHVVLPAGAVSRSVPGTVDGR